MCTSKNDSVCVWEKKAEIFFNRGPDVEEKKELLISNVGFMIGVCGA